jgi:hypothetical protein
MMEFIGGCMTGLGVAIMLGGVFYAGYRAGTSGRLV